MPEPTLQPTPTPISPSLPTPKRKSLILPLSLTILFFALTSAIAYLGYQNYQLRQQLSSPLPPSQVTPSPIAETSQYKTTKYGGLFSYDYPLGWNVAEIWPTVPDGSQGILIAMDPNPISTAPRDGGFATFMITLINGKPNPDEEFAKIKARFNSQNYTDIISETLQSDLGPIYHYSGKIAGEMLTGQPVETYYLTFSLHPNDPLNQQIISATLQSADPQLSAMLRHIVLSIKKLP